MHNREKEHAKQEDITARKEHCSQQPAAMLISFLPKISGIQKYAYADDN
jgi:hypothetical protein